MSYKLKGVFLILSICFIFQDVAAQYYRNQGYWRKNRIDLFGGIGASNFLGELGGRDQVGSDFIWDLDTKEFKPAITLGVKYAITKRAAARLQLSYMTLAGDDALTSEPFRRNRNLHFRSNTIEVGALFEYAFYEVRPGHRYNITGVKGTKPRAANIYGFLGIAGIRFNPQAKYGNEWVDLKPLGTEGQNFRDGAEPYSLYSIVVPMGLGYRWKLKVLNMFMGIEIGHRMTFTDYIDDVSSEYYDNLALGAQAELDPEQNLQAQYFADPSLGYYIDQDTGEQVALPNSTDTGQQRGDKLDNDAYLFIQGTLFYKLAKNTYTRRITKSRKGKRVVF